MSHSRYRCKFAHTFFFHHEKVDKVPVHENVYMEQWGVLHMLYHNKIFSPSKKKGKVPMREKVDMKQREVTAYAVSERSILTDGQGTSA